MDRRDRFDIGIARDFGKWDKARLAGELREVAYFINSQIFKQIPGLSAVVGLLAGAWVSSTFTASPLKGTLASLGLIKGGTHVIGARTYGFLSIFLPVVAVGITVYAVQKALKNFRERQLERNMARVARLGKDVQAEIREKLDLLERVKAAGIISESEFHTKEFNVYQAYSRTFPSRIEEFIIRKLTS